MSDKAIHGNRAVLTEQSFGAALGKALGEIKHADGLTWADMAAVLGKCPDQVANYYEASAKMDALTLYRGRQVWGSRLTGYIDRLGETGSAATGRECESSVLKAALALSVALSDDNEISAREIRANRQTIEAAVDALTGLLGKIKVAA